MFPGDIKPLLESLWEARGYIVPCLLGDPGIGKTQGVYEFAEEKGAKVVEIIASQILPNEVSGITMPVDASHSMEVYDHARLSSLEDGDILFFDELLQANHQVLSACLTLIQERRMMSGRRLPDVMIVAAANPLPSFKSIDLSIRQRFMFVDVEFSKRQWEGYMIGRHPEWFEEDACGKTRDALSTIGNMITHRKDNGWNSMTPRTAEKLLRWYIEDVGENGVEHVDDFISHNIVNGEAFLTQAEKLRAYRMLGRKKNHIIDQMVYHGSIIGTEITEAQVKALRSVSMGKMLDAVQDILGEEFLDVLKHIDVEDIEKEGAVPNAY